MAIRLASSQFGSNTIANTSCKAIFPQYSRQFSQYLIKVRQLSLVSNPRISL